MRQIFAFSGMLTGRDETGTSFDLVEHAVSLSRRPDAARVCYIPTAVGDSQRHVDATRETFARRSSGVELSVLTLFPQPSVPDIRAHLLEQDVVLVEGGSVANLLAVWRVHGLDAYLREAWQAGVVVAGGSAGSLCWHVGGPTDSYSDDLAPCTDGLRILPYSNGVHDDFDDQPRRERYRAWVASGALPAGYATEDGVGLHYVDRELHEAVTARDGSAAWWVEPDGDGGYRERRIEARRVVPASRGRR